MSVSEMDGAQLRAHMKRLKAMPGWHDPLADRLYAEIRRLDGEPALPQLQAVLADYDNTYADTQGEEYRKTHRALTALWWFTENVNDDTPDRSDVFFFVREIVRAGL